MKYELTYEKLMKSRLSRRVTIGLLATILLAAFGAGVIYAGLATRDVGKISGELVITDEAGVRQAALSATHTYSQQTQTGLASVEIKKDGVRVANASATVSANSQQAAAGGITALMLFLTGRRPVDRPTLQISNIQFSGDITVIKENADKIINWWDAKAKLAYDNYLSPWPTLSSLGKLQLTAWTIRDDGFLDSTFVILYFDPTDPTKIISGTLTRDPPFAGFAFFSVVSGSLEEQTGTPAPGDFHLRFATNPGVGQYNANLALEALPDGTVDVRGISRAGWPAGAAYTLEGIGNANFVIPGN
jgi:hypothetical protein